MSKIKWLSILATGLLSIILILFLQSDKNKEIEYNVLMESNKVIVGEIIMDNDNVKSLADEIEQINKQKQEQLNQAEEKENKLFEGFSEMKYTMLLETNTGFDASLNYYRYGLYDSSVKSRREGEELYFALHKKYLGKSWILQRSWQRIMEMIYG